MTSSSSNEQHSRVKFSDPLKKPQISPVQNSITLMKTILDNSKLPQSISSFSSSEKTLINTSYNLLKDLFQQATPTPLKYHLTHSITAPSAFSRGKFIKTLLNILSRFYTKIFHYNYGFDIFNNINHVIIRMYIDKLLTLDDIEKIVKFYFIFSCLYSQEKGSCQVGMRNYVIKNYEFIEIAFKLMLNVFVVYSNNNEYSNEEIQVIVSLLQFFEHSFIVDNYANVFYLTNSAYKYRYSVFRLLRMLSKNSYKFQDQIQNDTLYNQCKRLFLSIFKHNFTYAKFMAPILNISKDILVNFNTHSITQFKYNFQRLNFIIQYLHDAYFEECKHYRNDQYAVNTMFYFGKKDAGLALSLGKICRDNINIIFSFKLIPKKLRSKFIILGFTADQHHLMVYLQREVNDDKPQQQQHQCVKYKLMFKHNKNEIETSFHIDINKTYIFLLTLGNKQIKIQNNQSEFTFETKFNASDKLQINVGYFHKEDPTQSYTFNGCIGTIIGITKLSEDHIAQIFKLKGQYESILYDSNYINDNDISVNKTYHSNEAISKSFIETKHVAFIISPKTFQLKKPTDFYNKIKRMNMGIACSRSHSKTALPPEQKCVSLEQSNYLGLDSSMMYGQSIEMLSNIDQKFHVIQMKKTFNEFLKCDGLKFITMIFEYYYQIIVLYETQRYDDIYEILNIM